MCRLSPEQRHLMVDAVRRKVKKVTVAKVFGVSWKTVWYWCKRAFSSGRTSFKDKPRNSKVEKVTFEVESSILALRNTFHWGCERIRKALISLPQFMLETLSKLSVKLVQGVKLSRQAINDVLKKHKTNGYPRKKQKTWKFFRAKKPNILWQLDPKGPFTVQGKKYWWVVCLDDYSRYVVMAEQFDHCPTVEEITQKLKPLIKKHKPKKILTDNNPFREEWDQWCKQNKIEPLHAHPYYPQDKGKIERCIRNFAEEFIYLIRKFPQWLKGKLKQYTHWHNHKRHHKGINTTPAKLFT